MLLKEAAEECAAGASLFLQEEAYSRGTVVFDYEQADGYIKSYLAYIKRNSKALSQGRAFYTAVFEDDEMGYSPDNTDKIPAVTVQIHVDTADLFRVPFIEVTSLERRARYELPEGK